MIKLLKNKRIILPLAIIGSLICVGAFAADPGSSSDPLISLSYFEDKIDELKTTLLDDLEKTFSGKFTDLEKNVDKTLKEVSENGVKSSSDFSNEVFSYFFRKSFAIWYDVRGVWYGMFIFRPNKVKILVNVL